MPCRPEVLVAGPGRGETDGMVDDPGRVSVEEERGADGTLQLRLRVARADRGRVIGRSGKTADAMRTLLDLAASRRGVRCEVEVDE